MFNRLGSQIAPPNKSDTSKVFERNLQLNFPHYEIAISVSTSEVTFGENFKRILEDVDQMTDSFGLCGVLAVTANGLLANFDKWKDAYYDSSQLKERFDEWWKTKQGESAWMWFDKTYKDRFQEGPNDFAVLTKLQLQQLTPVLDLHKITRKVFEASHWKEAMSYQELNRHKKIDEKVNIVAVVTTDLTEIFDQLEKDEGIDIAVLCEYPIQKGIHTHWLAARKQTENEKILISGDLKPFGIPAAAINVPTGEVLKAMNQVIGSSPTTNLTSVLAEVNKSGRGLHNDKMFLMNFVRRKF
jgi:hypothetical protein